MTFSVAARCARTGMFGVAVASSSPAVGARCMFARAGVGAALSQNLTDPALGGRALDLLGLGATAEQAIGVLRASAPLLAFRQVVVVDRHGGAAVHTGERALGVWAEALGEGAACAGNLLANAGVPGAMAAAFAAAPGHLAARLLRAMEAGVAAGGEAGPLHSAGLSVVRDQPWPIVDLRVDWTEGCPIAELAALWTRFQPQMEAYVTRALDPAAADSYGVPGDPA